MDIEVKYIGGRVSEGFKLHEGTDNGVPVGIFEGHIAAWTVDEGLDRFHRGAFLESIQEHRNRQDRQVRLKDHHGDTVGGWPIEFVKEDDVGLFGRGHLNLEVERGRELYSMMKQRVIVDLSIGYSVIDKEMNQGIRDILKGLVWEGSPVDEPMNRDAQITAVKRAAPFADLPMSPKDYDWDPVAAAGRVLEWAEGHDGQKAAAYLCEGRSRLIADVVDGKLVAVRAPILEAAEELRGADDPAPALVCHVERYLSKMNTPSPFSPDQHRWFTVDDVKGWDRLAFENALVRTGSFTANAAKRAAGLKFAEIDVDPHKSAGDKARFDGIVADAMAMSEEMRAFSVGGQR